MALVILVLPVIVISFFMLWFNNNFGFFVLEFLGYHIEVSFSLILLLSIVLLTILFLFFKIFDLIFNFKNRYKNSSKYKKSQKGLVTVTEGFSAIIAGDVKVAEKLSKLAKAQLGEVPLVKLLLARSLRLSGNSKEANEYYNSLLSDKEGQIIAIKELLFQAIKAGDYNKAIILAEKSLSCYPNNSWAIPVLIDLYKNVHDWEKAKKIITKGVKGRFISKDKAFHLISVINIIMSKNYLEKNNFSKAIYFAEEAYKREPNFVPSVQNYTNILLITGKKKKAVKILEKSWKNNPNPLFPEIYSKIFNSYENQLVHLEKFVKLNPFSGEGNLFIANLALINNDYIKAEEHIKIAMSLKKTYNSCILMSRLLELEGESTEAVERWRQQALLAEKDDCWICQNCTHQNKDWSLNCPVCNSFDSIEWDKPLTLGSGSLAIKKPSVELASGFYSGFLD